MWIWGDHTHPPGRKGGERRRETETVQPPTEETICHAWNMTAEEIRYVEVEHQFLELLRLTAALGLPVTDDEAALNYAPRVFAVLSRLLPEALPSECRD